MRILITESQKDNILKYYDINEQGGVIRSPSDLKVNQGNKFQQVSQDIAGRQAVNNLTKMTQQPSNVYPDKTQIQRDVLDPYNVTPELAMRKKVMEEFYKKYGRYPTDNDFKQFKPEKYKYAKEIIDWISWIIKWLGPQGQLASRIVDAAHGLFYFYLSKSVSELSEQVINFFYGINYLMKALNESIPIPTSIDNFIKKIIDWFNKFKVSDVIQKLTQLGHKINDKFSKLNKFTQTILCVLAKYFGSAIEKGLDVIINFILIPLNELISVFNPTLGSYIDFAISLLTAMKGSIKTAKLIVTDIDKPQIIGKLTK